MRPRVYKCPECLGVWFTDEAHPKPPRVCPIDGKKLVDISHTREGQRLLLSHPVHLGAELETALIQFLTDLTDLTSGKSDLCPHCGEKVSKMESIAKSVYLRPCNHRLWAGRIPEAWKR